jgi:DNA-binding MltR family transcriptional regulator
VSADASRGFTQVAGELTELCYRDVKQLANLADQLAKTAREYGKSDEQITAAFNQAEYRYRPATLSASASGTGR